jgi:hypothetical protein
VTKKTSLRMMIAVVVSSFSLFAGATADVIVATPAHASPVSYYFEYIKNPSSMYNSTLLLQENTGQPGRGPATVGSWRAGSGLNSDQNDCDNGTAAVSGREGWLPDGTYTITQAFSNHSGIITGPALELSDHACSSGVRTRTQLFIHSTYPWGQAPPVPSQPYASDGCIIVSNTGGPSAAHGDIASVYAAYMNASPHPATLVVVPHA